VHRCSPRPHIFRSIVYVFSARIAPLRRRRSDSEVPENPSSSSNFRSLSSTLMVVRSKMIYSLEAPFVIFTHLSFGFCCTHHDGIVEQASSATAVECPNSEDRGQSKKEHPSRTQNSKLLCLKVDLIYYSTLPSANPPSISRNLSSGP
jgi:hypothetical protein